MTSGVARRAGEHRTRADSAVQPASEHFSGLVFKLQVGRPPQAERSGQ